AAQHHFGATVRQGVDGGEALEDADRVVAGEHGDGGAQQDALGAGGDACQHDVGRGDGEVGAMVLADAERVHAHPVGQNALLHDVAQDLRVMDGAAVAVDGRIAEGVEAKGDVVGGGRTLRRRRGGRGGIVGGGG